MSKLIVLLAALFGVFAALWFFAQHMAWWVFALCASLGLGAGAFITGCLLLIVASESTRNGG